MELAIDEMTDQEKQLWGDPDCPHSIKVTLLTQYGRKVCTCETCKAHGQPQSLDNFYQVATDDDGMPTYNNRCKECVSDGTSNNRNFRKLQKLLIEASVIHVTTLSTSDIVAIRGKLQGFATNTLSGNSSLRKYITDKDSTMIGQTIETLEQLNTILDTRNSRKGKTAISSSDGDSDSDSEQEPQHEIHRRTSGQRYQLMEQGLGVCNCVWCEHRGQQQPLSNFAKDGYNSTGYGTYCRKCSTIISQLAVKCTNLYKALRFWQLVRHIDNVDQQTIDTAWIDVVAKYNSSINVCDRLIDQPHDSKDIVVTRVNKRVNKWQPDELTKQWVQLIEDYVPADSETLADDCAADDDDNAEVTDEQTEQ